MEPLAENMRCLPEHVAIIMDGNGRWAKARNRSRAFGHQAGVKTVRKIIEDAADIGIKCMTLYSFSTENWTRPKSEILILFNLLRQYIHDDLDELKQNQVRVRILGTREGLQPDIVELIDHAEHVTRNNKKFSLNIAFNYGGRDEILRAFKRAAVDHASLPNLTEAEFQNYLDTSGLPDPDLVIRTSGEKRLSNYLLWQAAYAEFVFTDVLWPDFARADLEAAIDEFRSRDRRYGNVGSTDVEVV